jgi:hypothetical protein
MSTSSVVDERYRLQAVDLAGKRVTATVSNVSLQGLERIQPVLHFHHIPKRMVLDDAQSDAMARITDQAIIEAWIGAHVALRPTTDEAGRPTIAIEAADANAVDARALPAPRRQAPTLSWRQPVLLLLLLALAWGTIYLVENGATILSDIQQLFTPVG